MLDVLSQYLRLLEGKTKLLASQPYGGSVHYGHQLLRVFGEQLVEQTLVTLQQLDHVHVLVQGVLVTPQVPHGMVSLK